MQNPTQTIPDSNKHQPQIYLVYGVFNRPLPAGLHFDLGTFGTINTLHYFTMIFDQILTTNVRVHVHWCAGMY